jgi:hypothetical protein
MNRINTVNVTQDVFEEKVTYLNLYLVDGIFGGAYEVLEKARDFRSKQSGIILKITRTTDGDFMFEKVKEYP